MPPSAKSNCPRNSAAASWKWASWSAPLFSLIRFAPLGDPVEIKVRGYHLTLRRQDAEQISGASGSMSPRRFSWRQTKNPRNGTLANPVEAAGARSFGVPAAAAPGAALPATNFVVLTGNPNSGKTTVFNALTGLRARVGNYAGVTVERKEGRMQGAPADNPVRILDLPGAYSLSPQSLDEQIARDVLFQRLADVPAPAAVVVVVDASNLERNLYFATQVIELGYPTVIALNMVDVAQRNGADD